VKKLLPTVDSGLISDLLLVHKIDQISKMKIEDGQRMNQGELDNYNFIISNLESWYSELYEGVSEELHDKEEVGKLNSSIKAIWNGNLVMKHFGVSGPEIKKLLTMGQDYVRERLLSGDVKIPEEQVIDYIRKNR